METGKGVYVKLRCSLAWWIGFCVSFLGDNSIMRVMPLCLDFVRLKLSLHDGPAPACLPFEMGLPEYFCLLVKGFVGVKDSERTKHR
jgi:hypothetical protein